MFHYETMSCKHVLHVHELETLVMGESQRTKGDLERFLEKDGIGAVCYRRGLWVRSGKVIGYILFEGDAENQILHIRNIIVLPEFRRMKVATEFIHRVTYMARHAGWHCQADVNEENIDTQRLFRACEWRCIGIVSGVFPDGRNAYRFVFPGPVEVGYEVTNEAEKAA